MHTESWKKDWRPPKIEHGVPTAWNWVVLYPQGLSLGRYADIGAFTLIMAKYGVVIDDEVEVGSHCAVYSESSIDGLKGPVVLRKGCKVGTHTTIMPDTWIGEEAVVGAHSLVLPGFKVPPRTVAFGVPCRVIRTRTDKELVGAS